MANALDWIRTKATAKPSMSSTIEYKGKTYKSEWKQFRGNLPYRMRKELSRAQRINNEFEHETIRIECAPSGHQTGIVEYTYVQYQETP